MKQKVYQTPTTNVVKLQHQARLMAGSIQSQTNTVQDYNWNTEVEE